MEGQKVEKKGPERKTRAVIGLALRVARILGWALVTGLRVFFGIFAALEGRGDAASPPSATLYNRRKDYRP